MILQRDPGGRQHELIDQRKAFLQPVTNLRPAKSHLALEMQGARLPARPTPAHQPCAADPDEQDHPDARRVDQLHHKREHTDKRQDLCIQTDNGLHGLIIDYMLELSSSKRIGFVE